MKKLIVALALAVGLVSAQGVLETTHDNAAEALWTLCHSAQSIHELSTPPAHWPGTRAAHVTQVQNLGGGLYLSNQHFYTKSSIFDPTWDYYYSSSRGCP